MIEILFLLIVAATESSPKNADEAPAEPNLGFVEETLEETSTELAEELDIYVPYVPRYLQELLTPLEHSFTGGEFVDEEFRYRLYIPTKTQVGRKYPLVIWLMGGGQRGMDNVRQMRHLDETFFADPKRTDYNFFLLAPQWRRWRGWTDHSIADETPMEERDDMLTVLMSILENVEEEYTIDRKRIYVAGASSGGSAAWELCARYPGRFAAAVPMSSSPRASFDFERLKNTPIWAFHSPIDKSTSSRPVELAVKLLQEAGGTAALSFGCDYPGTKDFLLSHFSFRVAFEEFNVQDWMFEQSLGRKDAPPPGTDSTYDLTFSAWLDIVIKTLKSNYHVLISIAVLVILVHTCRSELKRRRNRNSMGGTNDHTSREKT